MVKYKYRVTRLVSCIALYLIDGVQFQEEPLGNVVVESSDHPEGVVLNVQDGFGVLQQFMIEFETKITLQKGQKSEAKKLCHI